MIYISYLDAIYVHIYSIQSHSPTSPAKWIEVVGVDIFFLGRDLRRKVYPLPANILLDMLLLLLSLQSCPTLETPETAAHRAPPSLGFSRQEYWSGVPLPSPLLDIDTCKYLSLLSVFKRLVVDLFGGCVGSSLFYSSCSEQGLALLLLQCVGFSLQWLLLLQSTGSRACRLSVAAPRLWSTGSVLAAPRLWSTGSVLRLPGSGAQAQKLRLPGSGAQAQKLWHAASVAPWHVGSFWVRHWTHVSCVGRWIPYHWATSEAPGCWVLSNAFSVSSEMITWCFFS